ncbi:hypothetical protein AVEN_240491-1 [Araneus ventricosus]|uniref:Uncharacterized protein n=1 Tax=Araneus ventricosus TaxID=182803 RepID=A0A4Y2HLY7_ARAVE|nr:hypothetical protein AVEN_240491-1 [Araneus ventricosus]
MNAVSILGSEEFEVLSPSCIEIVQVVKLRNLPTSAVFEPAHSKIEVQKATTGVESAATELEVLGCSSESPTKAEYKRKVAELGDIIEKKT